MRFLRVLKEPQIIDLEFVKTQQMAFDEFKSKDINIVEVEPEKIYKFITTELEDSDKFIKIILEYIKANP